MKNYNEIYGQLCSKLITDRENTVFEMTQSAAREFYQIALQKLPYISFEFEVVEQFLKEGYEPNTDLLQDYILSNDLADEVYE